MIVGSFFGFSGGGGGSPTPPTTLCWALNGNTVGSEKYFGTNDNFSIPIYTNGTTIGVFSNTGDFGFGTITPSSRVNIVGIDSTSSNYAFKVDNSSSVSLFSLRNDGLFVYNSTIDGATSGNNNFEYRTTVGSTRSAYYGETGLETFFDFYTNSVKNTTINEFSGYYAISSKNRFSIKTFNDSKSHLWMDGTTNGWIGIGDSYFSPTAQLHIQGIDATSSNFSLKVDDSSSAPILYARNNGNVGFRTSSPNYPIDLMGWYGVSSEQISLFAGYNIGMSGTTIYMRNPQPSGQPFRWVTDGVDGIGMSSAAGGSMGLHIGDNALSSQTGILTVGWSSVATNVFNCYNTSNSSIFKILQSGNVSIAVVSPTAKLHIQGSDSTSLNYSFKADDSSSLPLLYVRNDGGVSIGIATPLAKFHNFGLLNSINQRLEPVSNVTEDTTGGTVNTTDATANVTAQTIAVPTNKVISIESTIVYRKTGGAGVGTTGDGTTIKLNSSVKNISGTLTLDTVQNTYTGTVNAIIGAIATYTISGTNVLVSVTGVVNDNITWNVITKINTVA